MTYAINRLGELLYGRPPKPKEWLGGANAKVIRDACARLEEREAKLAKLRAFAEWAIREGPWEGYDLDGDDVQGKAEELGLIHPVEGGFDPDAHVGDAERGDPWFEFTTVMQDRVRGEMKP